MAYLLVSDFKNGLDRRRPRSAGVAGSLWSLRNGVISRGGDIEKAKRFVPAYTLPAGTHGLAQIGGQLFVFGSDALSVPPGLQYQRLQSPAGGVMSRVLDVETFDGKPYVIAEFMDGNIYHFYDGQRVEQWDAIAENVATLATLAAHLAERMGGDFDVRCIPVGNTIVLRANVPGVPFTVTAAGTGAAVEVVQANVPRVTNMDARGSLTLTAGTPHPDSLNRIDQVRAGVTDLLRAPVVIGASLTATANALAIAINNATSDHQYSAVAEGATVRIDAPPLTGAGKNGEPIVVTVSGDAAAETAPLAGGRDAVSPGAQISRIVFSGDVLVGHNRAVDLNGTHYNATPRASGTGTSAFVYKSRIYSVVQSLVYYSAINKPMDWSDESTSIGSGFLNVSNEASNIGRLQTMARYSDLAAVFARETIFTYRLNTDANLNATEQPLDNTGTIAPGSVVSYGASDVFYLDETGVRSLRARDSTNAAFVSDVGTVIDPFVQEVRAAATAEEVQRARAVVEPIDGRYMLAIGATVLILSNFPSSRITAWSTMALPFRPTDFVRSRREIYVRSADTIYLYGGVDGSEVVGADECVVETPFLDGGTPATIKQIKGFDISCRGTWRLEMLVDPNDETKVIPLGRVVNSTMHKEHIGVNAHTSAFAIRATCESDGDASLSQIAIHYDPNKAA